MPSESSTGDPEPSGSSGRRDEELPRITQILGEIDLADPEQAEELLALVYDQLRALAAKQMRREKDVAHTLQPTALVHEAYIRLAAGRPIEWEGGSHFFRVAARAMRQVLVDSARRRRAGKRGGAWKRVTLDSGLLAGGEQEYDVLDLHDALERLGTLEPRLEHLIELRFFAGLTVDEAAAVVGVSPRKAAQDWAAARLWLHRELTGADR
jgi:RNA polymerase sigma factor (TIGR02999 family)